MLEVTTGVIAPEAKSGYKFRFDVLVMRVISVCTTSDIRHQVFIGNRYTRIVETLLQSIGYSQFKGEVSEDFCR